MCVCVVIEALHAFVFKSDSIEHGYVEAVERSTNRIASLSISSEFY